LVLLYPYLLIRFQYETYRTKYELPIISISMQNQCVILRKSLIKYRLRLTLFQMAFLQGGVPSGLQPFPKSQVGTIENIIVKIIVLSVYYYLEGTDFKNSKKKKKLFVLTVLDLWAVSRQIHCQTLSTY